MLKGIKNSFSSVTEKDLIRGVVVVLLTGLFSGAANYIISSRVVLPAGVARGTLQAAGPVVAIVMTLVGFALSVAVYHAGSRILGGYGEMRGMYALAGFASAPMLVQSGLRAAYYFVVNDATDLTPNGSGVVRFMLNYFTVFSVAAIILTAIAVRQNYKTSGTKSLLIALLPVLVSMAFGFALRGFRLG